MNQSVFPIQFFATWNAAAWRRSVTFDKQVSSSASSRCCSPHHQSTGVVVHLCIAIKTTRHHSAEPRFGRFLRATAAVRRSLPHRRKVAFWWALWRGTLSVPHNVCTDSSASQQPPRAAQNQTWGLNQIPQEHEYYSSSNWKYSFSIYYSSYKFHNRYDDNINSNYCHNNTSKETAY